MNVGSWGEAVKDEVPRSIGGWFTAESILEDPHNVSADFGARKALVPDSRAFCIGSPEAILDAFANPRNVSWMESNAFGNTEKILQYRAERLEAGAAPGTVNRELTVLRAMFYHGFEAYTPPKVSRVPKFPEKLKEANPRQGFLVDAQYDALQENCPYPWLRALLAIAYNFGFRRSELLGLRVDQVDLEARTISPLDGRNQERTGSQGRDD
jgi:integrase